MRKFTPLLPVGPDEYGQRGENLGKWP